MSRTRTSISALAFAAIATGACVEGRERPLTGLEDNRPDPANGPLAIITHPVEGQRFFEQTWVNGSGVQVTYTGRFRQGDELRLLAFLDYEKYSENLPFHVTEFTIQGDPDKATFVRGTADQFRGVVGVTILLEMHDPNGFLISADSVNTEIQ